MVHGCNGKGGLRTRSVQVLSSGSDVIAGRPQRDAGVAREGSPIGVSRWGSYWSRISRLGLVGCCYLHTTDTTRTAGLMTMYAFS